MNRSTQLALRDGLDLYLQKVGSIPVLSRVEERRLADKWYSERDPDAGRQLVVSNLRFVVKIAHEYARYGFRLADLIQEGNLGLLHAVDRFDPKRGFRLISYAVWWIRAYIQSFILRSWSIVRMGTTRVQRRIFSSLQKARQKIASMTTGGTENQKLALALDVPEKDLDETLHRMGHRDVSLDQPIGSESDQSVGDTMADSSPSVEAQVVTLDLREKVRSKLDTVYNDLTPRERYLVDHRLMSDSPATLEAVGHQFGITRERVRQIEERLKKRLRQHFAPEMGFAEPLLA